MRKHNILLFTLFLALSLAPSSIPILYAQDTVTAHGTQWTIPKKDDIGYFLVSMSLSFTHLSIEVSQVPKDLSTRQLTKIVSLSWPLDDLAQEGLFEEYDLPDQLPDLLKQLLLDTAREGEAFVMFDLEPFPDYEDAKLPYRFLIFQRSSMDFFKESSTTVYVKVLGFTAVNPLW
jgi:hypothetical protein